MAHTTSSVALNRLVVKRHAATSGIVHANGMGDGKKREPRSELQKVFLKRVWEEMRHQGLFKDGKPNTNALAARDGAPPQRTAYGAIVENSDPSLETVEKIAKALGIVPAYRLLVDPDPYLKAQDSRRHMAGGDISQFPLGETGQKGKAKRHRKE